MRVSTKKGDSGYTRLLRGERVSKHHLVIEAVGTLDETNSLLGLARASSKEKRIKRIILQVQKHLFIIGAELSVPKGRGNPPKKTLSETDIKWLWARGRRIPYGCCPNKCSKSGANCRQVEK
jgi:cob(I)alamin adenosyltransferase